VESGAEPPAGSRAQCDKRSSGGGTPSIRTIFHWFGTNLVSGPGKEWGFKPPTLPVALPLTKNR